MARGGCGAGITRHCRIPICVARHKENVTDRSRTTVRRDSCSSEAKSFAPLRGKPPYGARRLRSRHYTALPYPFCVARHKETRQYHSRTTMRRDSCSSVALPRNAKSFAPLRGKPPMARRNEKTRQKKNATFVSLEKTKVVSKTKVLKRKRQKIHISKHRIPICVARHKETRQNRSRTTVRRSCSSGATYPIKRGAAGCSKTAQRKDYVRDGSTRARRLCSRGDCQRCRDSALGQDGANRGLILR